MAGLIANVPDLLQIDHTGNVILTTREVEEDEPFAVGTVSGEDEAEVVPFGVVEDGEVVCLLCQRLRSC